MFADLDENDGLDALMLRIGAHAQTTGPSPRKTGGQFYLVLNGNLQHAGETYPRWSTLHLSRDDEPLAVTAGAEGVEALVLSFPSAPSQ